ncbi:PLP-dependent aminotransferase family protein [Methanoculleus sp. FWC-SCC1]|uniref:PLP-dependent aminotransferase family protein n=1 Tax=Methanoculleus frigidifontis TaxID=2584085 RepID=A0ABT8MDY4_9EURY|nr:PLP-dependent aminotransferase family protein [Methanoculleus sp. FWC-SCC1]MDN7026147.1 PLP-dependent aminotransferase family protein [Methanoculleus sp. FWC-SCC1]
MPYHFASRMEKTPKSFIREILKTTERPEVISFAGGLPSPALFAVEELAAAAQDVMAEAGRAALQYSTTEGYLPLREFIAGRYRRRLGLAIDPDEILITNGSQQCLDLIGKVLLDPGDPLLIERPGYLGAIQAFSLYEPAFRSVPLIDDGPDTACLEAMLEEAPAKLFYGVPSSQNPSGITYSAEKRRAVAALLAGTGTIFVEDDAYGELRFDGESLPSLKSYLPDATIITGSFSKIVTPGLRLGWIAAPGEIMEQITVAKQASDLHSNYLAQRIIARYLETNDIDAHIARITDAYQAQRDLMIAMIEEEFPDGVSYTRPDGGMFLWVTLPEGCPTTQLLEEALRQNVAFVPGRAFYVDGGGDTAMRLNFSNADEEKIVVGMRRLGAAVRRFIG